MITFTKSKLPYGWFGNMSPFPIQFLDRTWKTAEALFQALRFDDESIRELIRAERSPLGAKIVAKKHVEKMVVKPCSDGDVYNMEVCLALKLEQHPHLKAELLATGSEKIIEDVTARGSAGNNLFWGMLQQPSGEWTGLNTLGYLWMKLRDEVKACGDAWKSNC